MADQPRPEKLGHGHAIAIVREHPFWSKLVALHAVQPELAYSLTMRKIGLELNLGVEREGKLFTRLVQALREAPVAP